MLLQVGEVAGKKRQIVHPSDLTLEYFDVWRATDAIVPIEFCVYRGAIAGACPLTCILSPNGGEDRVRGMSAHPFYDKCKTQ